MRKLIGVVAVSAVIAFGCGERIPKQDQMAVIRDRFSKVQAAIREQNVSALDSLSSRDMADEGLSVDSLLRFVFGAERAHAFARFGKYEFIYNNKKARIDCPLVDTAVSHIVM